MNINYRTIIVILLLILLNIFISRLIIYNYYYSTVNESRFPISYDMYNDIIIAKADSNDYRLGDLILFTDKRKEPCGLGWGVWRDPSVETLEECTIRKWPNSIAAIYLKRTNKKQNIKVLNNILLEKEKIYTDLPDDDTAVFHLRIGDVIDIDQYINKSKMPNDFKTPTANDFWKRKTSSRPDHGSPPWSYYVLSKDQLKHIIVKMKMSRLRKICFVYGVHTDGNFTESRKYLAMCKQLFELNGIEVKTKSHSNADESFTYMCNSKYFIKSSGGFSNLIATVVKYRSNTVFC